MSKITTFQNLKIQKQSGEAVPGFSLFAGKTGKEKNRVPKPKGEYLKTDTSIQGSFSSEKALPDRGMPYPLFLFLSCFPQQY